MHKKIVVIVDCTKESRYFNEILRIIQIYIKIYIYLFIIVGNVTCRMTSVFFAIFFFLLPIFIIFIFGQTNSRIRYIADDCDKKDFINEN